MNGSSIRPWWIHHHYWAMVTTTLVLALPVDSAAVQAFVHKFLWWSCFQARGSGAPASFSTILPGPWLSVSDRLLALHGVHKTGFCSKGCASGGNERPFLSEGLPLRARAL